MTRSARRISRDERRFLAGAGKIDQHVGLALIDQIEGRRIVAADQVGAGQAFDLDHFAARQPQQVPGQRPGPDCREVDHQGTVAIRARAMRTFDQQFDRQGKRGSRRPRRQAAPDRAHAREGRRKCAAMRRGPAPPSHGRQCQHRQTGPASVRDRRHGSAKGQTSPRRALAASGCRQALPMWCHLSCSCRLSRARRAGDRRSGRQSAPIRSPSPAGAAAGPPSGPAGWPGHQSASRTLTSRRSNLPISL